MMEWYRVTPMMVASSGGGGGPCDALRAWIGMTINLPGHLMSMTQHYFSHE